MRWYRTRPLRQSWCKECKRYYNPFADRGLISILRWGMPIVISRRYDAIPVRLSNLTS